MRFPWYAYFLLFVIFLGKQIGLAKSLAKRFILKVFLNPKIERAFDNYKPNKNDIFVATYAKSGTNMMLQMAIQMVYKGNAEFKHIHELVPWPDTPLYIPVKLEDQDSYKLSVTGQRVIKTHLAAKDIPYSSDAKYLCVLRNPNEVLVSTYHFVGGMLGVIDKIELHDWVDMVIDVGIVEACMEHAAGFWALRDKQNVLVQSYRDAVKDPNNLIREAADILEVDLDSESFAKVKEKASFAYMKQHESCFEPPANPYVRKENRAKMVRSGKAGKAKQQLLERQVVEINRRAKVTLEKLGSDFPYDTYY